MVQKGKNNNCVCLPLFMTWQADSNSSIIIGILYKCLPHRSQSLGIICLFVQFFEIRYFLYLEDLYFHYNFSRKVQHKIWVFFYKAVQSQILVFTIEQIFEGVIWFTYERCGNIAFNYLLPSVSVKIFR